MEWDGRESPDIAPFRCIGNGSTASPNITGQTERRRFRQSMALRLTAELDLKRGTKRQSPIGMASRGRCRGQSVAVRPKHRRGSEHELRRSSGTIEFAGSCLLDGLRGDIRNALRSEQQSIRRLSLALSSSATLRSIRSAKNKGGASRGCGGQRDRWSIPSVSKLISSKPLRCALILDVIRALGQNAVPGLTVNSARGSLSVRHCKHCADHKIT